MRGGLTLRIAVNGQMVVEKMLASEGVSRTDMGREAFTEKAIPPSLSTYTHAYLSAHSLSGRPVWIPGNAALGCLVPLPAAAFSTTLDDASPHVPPSP